MHGESENAIRAYVLRAAGWTWTEIADALGLSTKLTTRNNTARAARKSGWPWPPPPLNPAADAAAVDREAA